jgi:hypothetical protein
MFGYESLWTIHLIWIVSLTERLRNTLSLYDDLLVVGEKI